MMFAEEEQPKLVTFAQREGQINQRVMGTEKFWTPPRLEAVVQSRAAYLSGDERTQQPFLHRKPGRSVGAGRLAPAA